MARCNIEPLLLASQDGPFDRLFVGRGKGQEAGCYVLPRGSLSRRQKYQRKNAGYILICHCRVRISSLGDIKTLTWLLEMTKWFSIKAFTELL